MNHLETRNDEICPPGSLNNLHLRVLLRKAGVSKECREEARKVYKRKYQNHQIVTKFKNVETNKDLVIEKGVDSGENISNY